MRPFEFMSGTSIAPRDKIRSPKPFDEAIAQFLTISAHYMNLPAERVTQLIQQKNLS